MPESFGSSTTAGYIYSIYATYTTEQEEAPELIGNPYMFTGWRFDIETGLYYYRARYYNPHIGRFMQTDPVGYDDGINWYLYCNNNPLSFVDPSGNLPFSPDGSDVIDTNDRCDSCDLTPDCCDVIDSEPEPEKPMSEATTMFLLVIFLGEGATLVEGLSLAGKAGLAVGAAKGALIAGTAYVFYEMGTEIGEPIAVPLATGIAFVYVKAETVYTWASDSVKDAWDKKERARKAARKKTQADKVGHRTGKLTERGSRASGHSSRKKYRQRLKKFCPICGLPRSQCPGH